MKTIVLLLTLAIAPLGAQLTQGDRNFALSNLHASSKMFLDSIAGLSAAQWNFKPAPERWSIAECAEHVALTEEMLMKSLRSAVQSPAPPVRPNFKAKDQELLKRMADRSQKAQAPKEIQPTGRFQTPEAAARYFREKREATLDYARTTNDDLRGHVAGKGNTQRDAYQYLLMIAGHAERHVSQINEVKAAAGYPKQ